MSVTDNKGRSWQLLDHVQGPWVKDLAQREQAYLAKHGEQWDGSVYGNRILTPGNWQIEFFSVPLDMS